MFSLLVVLASISRDYECDRACNYCSPFCGNSLTRLVYRVVCDFIVMNINLFLTRTLSALLNLSINTHCKNG